MKRSIVLVILDGWGIGREDETNPVHVVNPGSFKWLKENFPLTSLQASGISVGLPWGETGNSEVGHLTLGAGKVIYQYYPKITMAIRNKSFFENPVLKSAFAHARKNNSAVNFAGLLTKANVHASLDHLEALIRMGEIERVPVKLHLFADGKDSPPHSLEKFLKEVPKEKIATLTGRYYAMDRNQNWRLTQSAYDNLTGRGGTVVESPDEIIKSIYSRDLSEEFLPPIRFGTDKEIKDGDALVFFNYREDSIRQLAESFITEDFNKFPLVKFRNLYVATFTHYEDKLKSPIAFEADKVEKPIGAVLSDAGKNQLRLAETYKYAHVTYFFNGYREPPYKNEYRVLIPSISAVRVEDRPEMMASAITDRLIEAVQTASFDFVLVNYSNPDTIAHTANYDAGLKAVQTIDKEIGRLLKIAASQETALIITSDHGNIEEMLSPSTGLPESQHDPNPVPFYLMAPEFKGRKFVNWKNIENETMGSLADVAPTILELFGIQKPPEMTGRSLLDGLL
jgi:2,3-bisphosphoglycerate-independent phosphoglycerate mutase